MQEFPIFESLPFETLIHQTQQEYHQALAESDRTGNSTAFIEYMLSVIDTSLNELVNVNRSIIRDTDRLEEFLQSGVKQFSRIII